MATRNIPSTYGAGLTFGNTVFLGTEEYSVPVVPETPPTGWGISIYSPSGDYIGSFEILNNNVPFLLFELNVKKIGGLDSFIFEIERKATFPFFNQMEARIAYKGFHWYTGEVLFVPSDKGASDRLKFEGKGYYHQLKDVKVNYTVSSKTLLEILQHVATNYFSQIDVVYNATLLNPPDVTVTAYEFKNKSLYDIILKCLQIANYNFDTEQYTFGVNKNKEFYFLPISDEPVAHYFEGYHFQAPKVEQVGNNLLNRVEIWRTLSGSSETEYVSAVQNLDSIAKYGIKSDKITIPDYLDSSSAEKIASAIVNEYKDLKTKISIDSLVLGEPLEQGYYLLSTKPDFYAFLISECDSVAEWDDSNLTNASLDTSNVKVFTGRRALLLTVPDTAMSEYIEIEFDGTIYSPDYMRIFVWQSVVGSIIKIIIFQDDVNYEEFTVEVETAAIWDEWDIDLTPLKSAHKIRIEIIAAEEAEIYIDRIDVFAINWAYHRLMLEEIKYTFKGNTLIAQPVFGDQEDNILEDLKKLNDETNDIKSIFERDV